MRTYNNADKLADVRDDDVYAEEIPLDEGQTDGTDDFVVGGYHFQKDPTRPHGVPFRFVVRHNEPFAETKKRLQVRIGASDKELSRMKFVLYQPQMYAKPNALNDGPSALRSTCADPRRRRHLATSKRGRLEG